MRDRWAQLTCGFRRTERSPECTAQPRWRLTSALQADWDPGTSPFRQQYTCDGHLEEAVERYGTDDDPVVYEPLDDRTKPGTPLVESRRPGEPLSERMDWIETRADRIAGGNNFRLREAYMHAAREWFAGHPEGCTELPKEPQAPTDPQASRAGWVPMTQYRLWCTGSDRDGWLELGEEAARESVLSTLKEWARDELLEQYDPFGEDCGHCADHEAFSNTCEDCTLKEYERLRVLMDQDMAGRLEGLWDALVRDGYTEVVRGGKSIAFSMEIIEEGQACRQEPAGS